MKFYKVFIGTLIAISLSLLMIFAGIKSIKNDNFINLSKGIEIPRGETLRFETAHPIGKTNDGTGAILVDSNDTIWSIDNFYAEETDSFILAITDKGTTKDISDDEIVKMWVALD